jgi:VWFA-related protein
MRVSFAIAVLLFGMARAVAQEVTPAGPSAPKNILLNVVVAPKSGTPVSGLQKQDFALADNKGPQTIKSFRAVTAAQEPVSVILLIDAVNTDFDRVSYVREQVMKFLRQDNGKLSHPTSIAVLTDKGTQIEKGFSTDGNALSGSLDHYTIGLRQISRSAGFWGAQDRLNISLTAVRQLMAYGATIPGRKVLLWVSPGWPLLSGPGINLGAKEQQQIFGEVVGFSQQLQQANMTLYSINPLGPNESLVRQDYYQVFVKGVSKSNQTNLADLSIQVLSIQSGGLTLNGSNDMIGSIEKCLADANAWYEITFDPAVAEQPNEYHHIEVQVDKPGLLARTRQGYYAQP